MEWADKRLNGTVVTQTVTGKKPKTGIDTINGKNAIYFDGIDDFFDLPSMSVTGKRLIACSLLCVATIAGEPQIIYL